MTLQHDSGLGDSNYRIAVYIANRPPLEPYRSTQDLSPLVLDELTTIGQQCGNGWRKVFNVYAKLLYALNPAHFDFSTLEPSWQLYRDKHLLQSHSQTALLFSPPVFTPKHQTIHLVIGRTYAKSLLASGQLNSNLHWLDDEFGIDHQQRLIVCPYFDYRQLSNIKIERLALLMAQLMEAEVNNALGNPALF